MEATEIHIIPQDENDINQIYYAMNHCQTLNPDPNESLSDEDGKDLRAASSGYDNISLAEDFMEAEGDESDDGAQGDMRNLHLNDGKTFDILSR